jgi:hypothetical protein
MKKTFFTTMMMLLLGVISATIASAQSLAVPATSPPATTQSKDTMAHDQMMMATAPDYVMATAYHQSLLTFARALNGQAVSTTPMNVAFARDEALTQLALP